MLRCLSGHIVQFVNNFKTTTVTTDMYANTTTYTFRTGCQVVITPKYSNSIIYGLVTFNYWFNTNADHNDVVYLQYIEITQSNCIRPKFSGSDQLMEY